jgi:hypothetical protein
MGEISIWAILTPTLPQEERQNCDPWVGETLPSLRVSRGRAAPASAKLTLYTPPG